MILRKDGITIEVPESDADFYLRTGYRRVPEHSGTFRATGGNFPELSGEGRHLPEEQPEAAQPRARTGKAAGRAKK